MRSLAAIACLVAPSVALAESAPSPASQAVAAWDAGTAAAPEAVRPFPSWPMWTTLALGLASAAGAGVAFGYDLTLSDRSVDEPELEDDAATWSLVSGLLGGVAGLALAVTLVLAPYVVGGRPSGAAAAMPASDGAEDDGSAFAGRAADARPDGGS